MEIVPNFQYKKKKFLGFFIHILKHPQEVFYLLCMQDKGQILLIQGYRIAKPVQQAPMSKLE